MSDAPQDEAIEVRLPQGGYAPLRAAEAVRASRLEALFAEHADGPFGLRAAAVGVLEALATAVDMGLAARAALTGAILDEQRPQASFSMPELTAEQAMLVRAFQLVVTADAARLGVAEWAGAPPVEGGLDLDGLADLLGDDDAPEALACRLMRLGAAYLELEAGRAGWPGLAERLAAFFGLFRRAVADWAASAAIRPLLGALEARQVRVAGHDYDGLELREAVEQPATGLLDVRPADIVGNDDYLSAGLRLARDVAGYDFAAGRNPKRINPVLFGLGRPGSGKTITAHAVGRYFLDYCRERGVPARFRVIHRTDWASSYQNASARNLLRIFREEVYGFDGVCGVYWPDIDTAFASRSSSGLRAEEKQNLGAVFGLFDGTLIPKDGKWFLLCDANTLHMDEATISRIAQNPMAVEGPTTPDQYVELMRDIMLSDVAPFVPDDAAAWQAIGELACDNALSGRNVEALCNNIRAHIQDFDYPDRYFDAEATERQRIIASLCRPVDAAQIRRFMDDYVAFRKDAEERAADERFAREVESIVTRLNASRVAEQLTRQ